jgi:shikimate kinase
MIQLIGPGGAGNSTVGALLAARLACPFLDLDREFERRLGNIDDFISTHGYSAYARENFETYRDLMRDRPDGVLAFSSGFMVYPASVHPAYPTVRAAIASDHTTLVLLPSLDRGACVAETVQRQLARPTSRRDAARERAVVEERFGQYAGLPARKVETMCPPAEVVAAILEMLEATAAESPSAASQVQDSDHANQRGAAECAPRAQIVGALAAEPRRYARRTHHQVCAPRYSGTSDGRDQDQTHGRERR